MKKSRFILALNSGSSSLKFGLYRVDSAGAEKLFSQTLHLASTLERPDALARVASVLAASAHLPPPQAVGRRVVPGGPALR